VRAQLAVDQQKEVLVRPTRRQEGLVGAQRTDPAAAQDPRKLRPRHSGKQRVIGERRARNLPGHHGLDSSLSRRFASIVSRFFPASRR